MELLENVVISGEYKAEKYLDSDFDTFWKFLQYA